jgi:hypothetical protein
MEDKLWKMNQYDSLYKKEETSRTKGWIGQSEFKF